MFSHRVIKVVVFWVFILKLLSVFIVFSATTDNTIENVFLVDKSWITQNVVFLVFLEYNTKYVYNIQSKKQKKKKNTWFFI